MLLEYFFKYLELRGKNESIFLFLFSWITNRRNALTNQPSVNYYFFLFSRSISTFFLLFHSIVCQIAAFQNRCCFFSGKFPNKITKQIKEKFFFLFWNSNRIFFLFRFFGCKNYRKNQWISFFVFFFFSCQKQQQPFISTDFDTVNLFIHSFRLRVSPFFLRKSRKKSC